MSTACQAKAARRKARSNNAQLGNALIRRRYPGFGRQKDSIHEAIAREKANAARLAKIASGKKKK